MSLASNGCAYSMFTRNVQVISFQSYWEIWNSIFQWSFRLLSLNTSSDRTKSQFFLFLIYYWLTKYFLWNPNSDDMSNRRHQIIRCSFKYSFSRFFFMSNSPTHHGNSQTHNSRLQSELKVNYSYLIDLDETLYL